MPLLSTLPSHSCRRETTSQSGKKFQSVPSPSSPIFSALCCTFNRPAPNSRLGCTYRDCVATVAASRGYRMLPVDIFFLLSLSPSLLLPPPRPFLSPLSTGPVEREIVCPRIRSIGRDLKKREREKGKMMHTGW